MNFWQLGNLIIATFLVEWDNLPSDPVSVETGTSKLEAVFYKPQIDKECNNEMVEQGSKLT